MITRKIYLASSWRNVHQPHVLDSLKMAGHEVYDFRHPTGPDSSGFAWSELDPDWEAWDRRRFAINLGHGIAQEGYENDWSAMEWADTGVLLLPSGRSAHLEAGYFAGAPGKRLFILLLEDQEPELMYKMGTICLTVPALIAALETSDV